MANSAKRARDRAHDAKRRTEKPWRRWYSLPVWRQIRKAQLAKQPLCQRHLKRGRTVPATVADHVVAHLGNWDLFIDADNLCSLCSTCHNSAKHSEEMRGHSAEIGADGLPVDPAHPFYR